MSTNELEERSQYLGQSKKLLTAGFYAQEHCSKQ
jgi:hypothetical protein